MVASPCSVSYSVSTHCHTMRQQGHLSDLIIIVLGGPNWVQQGAVGLGIWLELSLRANFLIGSSHIAGHAHFRGPIWP